MIMKKGLLLLLAVFSMGMARAQVEVTDVSGMDYAVYFDNPTVVVGQETSVPFYLKTKWAIQGVQTDWDLPEGFSVVKGTPNPGRFNPDNQGVVFAPNDVRIAATVLHKDGFYAGDDILGYITFKVDESIAPGEYAITLHDCKISGVLTDGSEEVADFWLDPIVCKITVSDAIDLFDTATEAPVAAEDVNVVVHRTFKGGEWSTICLPFDMDADQIKEAFGSAEVAEFTGIDTELSEENDEYAESIDVEFSSVSAIEANHPYLIKVESDIEQFRVDGVTIDPDDELEIQVGPRRQPSYFTGTYTVTTIPAESLFLSNNKFYYSVGNTTIKGFRGYFTLFDLLYSYVTGTEVKVNMTVDGTTAISNIDLTKSNNNIFNVNGIKMGNDMNRLNKGIYIVNGKKIVK